LLSLYYVCTESWQNGYCTGLENRRPQGLGGSNPSLSAVSGTSPSDTPPICKKYSGRLSGRFLSPSFHPRKDGRYVPLQETRYLPLLLH
jgi:hypothetical protein